jgi:signal transduction histidine kinase
MMFLETPTDPVATTDPVNLAAFIASADALPLTAMQLHSYLQIVNTEVERLGVLVDDLLMLARADADELHIEVVPAAGELLQEVY